MNTNNTSRKKFLKVKQRPLSCHERKSSVYYRLRSTYNKIKNRKNTSYSNIKLIKNKFNRTEESSLDTIDNEYSNKINYLLEHNSNNNNNSLSVAKNSFYIKSKNSSGILLKGSNRQYNTNLSNRNYEKKSKPIFNVKNTFRTPTTRNKKNYIKYTFKRKNDFRIDKQNFGKDMVKKKIFLDTICNKEIKFHRELLSSKSCELEWAKDQNEFDSKKVKRDAEMTFNRMYELIKSSTNKKNFTNYLNWRSADVSIPNNTNNHTSSSYLKIQGYSLYECFNEEDKFDNKPLDAEEKKKILIKNEAKMKELNMEYEQMIQKENDIKDKKIKLLEEIMKK